MIALLLFCLQTPEILDRVDAFLQKSEKDGIARVEPAWKNATEEIRLSVVPQLLGYVERHRKTKDKRHLEDIQVRADFLVANIATVASGGPFDGMLAYALLMASEATGEKAHRDAGDRIALACRKLSDGDTRANGGLMVAMGLAKHGEMAKDEKSRDRAINILDRIVKFQNEDGSFPHWTPGSKDLHYTAWMCVELTLIQRSITHAGMAEVLKRATAFLGDRIGKDGLPVYENFWSQASGCPEDYDTRGWTNELGYYVVALKGGPRDRAVKALAGLEKDGAFPDKWAFPHKEDDPVYAVSRGERSVVRTSLVFWMLALAAD